MTDKPTSAPVVVQGWTFDWPKPVVVFTPLLPLPPHSYSAIELRILTRADYESLLAERDNYKRRCEAEERIDQIIVKLLERAELAESKLAALKKRVADAPIHSFRFDFDTGIVSVSTMFPEDYAGKRVRLLLEDET